MMHVLGLVFFFLVSAPMAVLPMAAASKAGELLGAAYYHVFRRRRGIAISNIRAAAVRRAIETDIPPHETAKRIYLNMGRSMAEIVKVFYGMADRMVGDISVEGMHHYEASRAKGKGVIMITGHCGNWELLALTLPAKIGPAMGVARRLKNPYLNRILERARQRYGGTVVYQEGALRTIISELRRGGTVGIVMDQIARPEHGVMVDFLGAKSYAMKMPAAVAKRTGASVMPVFIRRMPDGRHLITIRPGIELTGGEAADTQAMMNGIEDYIRQYPWEWMEWVRKWRRG